MNDVDVDVSLTSYCTKQVQIASDNKHHQQGTLTCAIGLPHNNLSTFHIELGICYQNYRTHDYFNYFYVVVAWMSEQVYDCL